MTWPKTLLGSLVIFASFGNVPLGLANVLQSFEQSRGIQFLEEIQSAITTLVEQVKPTVVNISPIRDSGSRQILPRGRGPNTPGSGSGVIIGANGYIVTNNHVMGEAPKAEIRLSDKTTLIAQVIGRDPDTDLALLKVDTDRELPTAQFGDSSSVKVGQWVLAVGNPFGLDRTVTLGVVSGIGRENMNLSRYENFIQTDASINPGNSGGPLFNLRGEVIGINTAIINFAQGIGFSIPSNMANKVINQLRKGGKVVRGWLGVGIQPLTPELASKFQVKDGTGVLVNEVFKDEPADQAGILPGDVITKVGGHPVDTPNQLSRLVAGIEPGEIANIELVRDGTLTNLPVSLGVKKENSEVASLSIPKEDVKLGIEVQPLTHDLAKTFNLEEVKGVLVKNVQQGSIAHTEGLRKGDLIKEINRNEITTLRDYDKEMNEVNPGETILLRVLRKNRAFYVVLRPHE